jgi:outer membrane protein assembly factor BamB
VFTATGNAIGSNEHYGYSEHVVKLDASLAVQDSNYPGLTGTDVDFGSTPMLYRPSGCMDKLAVMNKTGQLFVYNRGSIGSGPFQTLQISKRGTFIGVVAYSPVTKMLYVPNPNTSASGTYKHGLVALSIGSDCLLSLAWQKSVGSNNSSVASPTVANGVVYFGDGQANQVFAFDAATGAQLWTSGSQIGGSVYAAPTVADGKLFVGSWDDHLYAFAPS